MNLFIIGNGFDAAHGLETSYVDFRNYLETTKWDFLTKFEEPYGYVPENRREIVEELLWKEFERNLSNINEDEIVDGATSMELGLEGGDIDIESTLNVYWEEEYKYVKQLNEYIAEWVREIDIDVQSRTSKIKQRRGDIFLTFNYTLVLEKVYKIDPQKILHIHGSVDDDYGADPVVGHGNYEKIERLKGKIAYAERNYLEKESSIYNALVNYYERTKKDVDFYLNFNSSFFNRMSEVENIYVIGHSWGDVDIPYFKEVFKNVGDNAVWNIYYYKPKEEETFINKAMEIGIAKSNIITRFSGCFFDINKDG